MLPVWVVPGLAVVAIGALAAALLATIRRLARERTLRASEGARLREQLEHASRERIRWRSIFDAIPVGLVALDSSARVTWVNLAARELLALEGEPGGRPVLEIARSAEIEAAVRSAQQHGQAQAELRIGASERLLEFLCVAYPAEQEETRRAAGTVGVLRDVSAERRLERVRRDFVANVSHEFRTPLTAIRGFAETLEDPAVAEARRARFAATIVRHARRLEQLVEDLLTLSEIEAGKRPLELREVDLSSLAMETIARSRSRFESACVAIELLPGQGAPPARADPRALELALENLLDNALKYTPEGGSVEVAVRAEGAEIALSVRDTGIGIPARDLPRIFERFYRVDRSRSRAPGAGGSGIGLALVKHLVELQDGRVTAQSEREHGSTFTIHLPRA
ncbi:MAG: sensor histidine kinase [Myxococcota bacterium]